MDSIFQTKAEALALKQELLKKINSPVTDTLMIADNPAPTTPVSYWAGETGTYPNAGGLVVTMTGKLTVLNFDGTTWSKVEAVIPVTDPAKLPIYNSANTYTEGVQFIKDGLIYIVKSGQTLNAGEAPEISLKLSKVTGDLELYSNVTFGQSETPYTIDVSASYMFVREEQVGVNGILRRIDFAQPIDYVVSPKLAILEKVGANMKIISVYDVTTTIGEQFIDISSLNIPVTENQYIGLQCLGYITKCAIQGTIKSYTFSSVEIVVNGESSTQLANGLVYDYSIDITSVKSISDKLDEIDEQIASLILSPLDGKMVDINGDSISWYDGNTYSASTHSESPNIALGYQSYFRSMLGASTTNNGISGATLPQIRTALVARNYSTTPYVTITGGINDWAAGTVSIGSIQSIGSTFNTATSYGAVQSMIEHILGQNPEARIFLITPIRGRIDALGEFPETYADMFKAIGKLYGIPVCDWYNGLSFNTLTYNEYYKDIGALSDRKVHVGNAGYKRMGEYLVQFLLNNI